MAYDINALDRRLAQGLLECGDSVADLRTFASRQIAERIRSEHEAENLRRELTALKGEPVAAPDYGPELEWSAAHGWSGPFHLVRLTRKPYPGFGDIKPGSLPDIMEPAPKALCGSPYRGRAKVWPACHEVCAECVRKGSP